MPKLNAQLFLATLIAFSAWLPASALDVPDAATVAAIPQGTLTDGVFDRSEVFPGTTRAYRVYVPSQYQSGTPANLMVFMDGLNYAKANGSFRTPEVLDRLIHEKTIPVTVAVFVNPGTVAATNQDASKRNAKGRSNRSFEYDSMDDRYANFLVNEFLPTALKGIDVSSDPADRAVCGISSGGICAFTAAWHRPDQFGKVLSHIGSFTNIRGGWAYPGLIRKTQKTPKPIKVYLQEGNGDLNNLHGNWPLANRDVAAALQFAGYTYKLEMTEGGHSGKFAGQRFPEALKWLWDDEAEGTTIASTMTKPGWEAAPEAISDTNLPRGTVVEMPEWESKIFANTIRRWAVYVPAAYDPKTPTALMVFQDGERLRDVKGRWRIPTVFDHLIARGDMPPTIAVFLDPGHDKSKRRQGKKSSNRSFEYDSLGDRYSRFLTEEILPQVESKYNISQDPTMRAIGGSSSGAICAFTVAWERPDQFGKVYSSVGSFTNLRGGNIYPALVRKTEPKPIRVYLADTSGDVDNAFGSWPIANERMASALAYMGYDTRLDWAEGYSHGPDYGSRRFPEAMKWLWRDEVHEPSIDTSDDLRGDLTLMNLLIPGESWEVVASDIGFGDAPCADSDGNFYFCDMRKPAIYRVDASDGKTSIVAEQSVSGMDFDSNGNLYGCFGKPKQVFSIDPQTGTVKVLAENVIPNDLAVSDNGFVYITVTRDQQITRIDTTTGATKVMDTGIARPNGIALSPDGGTLAVSEHGGQHVWTFRVNPDGTLDAKMPTMTLRRPIDPKGEFKFNEPPPYMDVAKGDGMSVDKIGRYYVTSDLGVQVFDPTGRICGVLPKPLPGKPLTSCCIGGANHDTLFITHGNTVYRRKLNVDQ